jgi:choline dehydrogenase
MPNITNANIYAPVMMIAEKAADLILGNAALAPAAAALAGMSKNQHLLRP